MIKILLILLILTHSITANYKCKIHCYNGGSCASKKIHHGKSVVRHWFCICKNGFVGKFCREDISFLETNYN